MRRFVNALLVGLVWPCAVMLRAILIWAVMTVAIWIVDPREVPNGH